MFALKYPSKTTPKPPHFRKIQQTFFDLIGFVVLGIKGCTQRSTFIETLAECLSNWHFEACAFGNNTALQ